jgi:hypothetical protein
LQNFLIINIPQDIVLLIFAQRSSAIPWFPIIFAKLWHNLKNIFACAAGQPSIATPHNAHNLTSLTSQ